MKNAIKRKILRIVGHISDKAKFSFIISYFHNRHRLPNLKNPKDLSEIWIKRVLDGKVNDLSFLADKHAVRDYISSKGLEGILTPEIAVYESADDINFDILPNKFALKANFGAGRNIICVDKSKLDYNSTREQIRKWLQPGSYSVAERHYNLIPRKFICEEFIDDGSGGFPIDYKFMCIHGKVHCILACSEREKGHTNYLPYSTEWSPMYHYLKKADTQKTLLPKPKNLTEMISTAEKIAENIDLVRIDLYSNGNRIWFGEITLTPSGCIFHRWSDKALKIMGSIYRNYP